MAKSKDTAEVSAQEDTQVVTISAQEWAEIQSRLAAADVAGPNPAPAVEEGPHLQDPDIRQAKIEQVQEHGDLIVGMEMPDDMVAILEEAGV